MLKIIAGDLQMRCDVCDVTVLSVDMRRQIAGLGLPISILVGTAIAHVQEELSASLFLCPLCAQSIYASHFTVKSNDQS
jgi:hypothetical protein